MIGGAPRGTPRLLDGRDLVCMALVLVAGTALRAWCFNGWGLGDDIIFRHSIGRVLNWQLPQSNMTYRVAWWLPTSAACALFGLAELPLVLPITAFSVLGLGVVYALGKHFYGRAGGIIAGALAVVVPLDVIWSTMVAPDVILSFWSAVAMLCLLRASVPRPARSRRILLALAGVAFWFAFHSKASAGLLAPAVLFVLVWHVRAYGRDVLVFLAAVAVLGAVTLGVSWYRTGDLFYPMSSEMFAQGLRPDEAPRRQFNRHQFWIFPKLVFLPNWFGDPLFSLYPQLALAALVGAGLLGLRRGAPEAWAWALAVFVGLQFNIQRVDGYWIAGFRNVRHLHPLIAPVTLIATGILVSAYERRRALTVAVTTGLVAFGAWATLRASIRSQDPFADLRWSRQLIASLPRKPFHQDGQIEQSAWILPGGGQHYAFRRLPLNPGPRPAAIARITDGYIFTGGGRNPYYGCLHCIPLVTELDDPSRWRLVAEREGRIVGQPWRPEPMRLWERLPPAPLPPPAPSTAQPPPS